MLQGKYTLRRRSRPSSTCFKRVHITPEDADSIALQTTGRKIDSKTSRRSSTFNAGVGGDKIENVLYRLKEGLLSSLASLPVKLWVVHVGTNNLRPKGPLRPNDIENYRLLLRALRSISAPDTQALVVGIFRRKDREDSCVRDSNVAVKALVEEMSQVNGSGRMHFVEEPDELTAESLVDHVHLDEEGYRIWDRVLSEKIEQIVG